MTRTHEYAVSVTWTGDRGSGTSGYRDYDRAHEVSADGVPTIAASSDPALHGDASRWNPEQLITASLAQCHMLWFLHLCATAGIVVTGYADEAQGTMVQDDDDGGRFTEVVLRPRVTVAAPDLVEPARRLHAAAHEKCFIANSVNFPVLHEPVVLAGDADHERA